MDLVLLSLQKYLLNGNVYHFLVDYNSIDKSHILNIHKYLTNENKIMFSLIKKVLAKAFDRTKFVSVNDEP